MTPTAEPAQHVERSAARWRRAFLGIYLVIVIGSCTVVFFSVLAVHIGAYEEPVRGRRIGARADDPRELRDCHRRLEGLMTGLHKEAFTLLAKSQRFEIDPAAEWQNWSGAWRAEWRALDWRCRFGELGGSGASPEIDKMAGVHRSLDELQLAYTGVVNTFADRYVDRLRTLRQDVASVRAMIDRRQTPGSSPRRRGATQ